MTEIKIFDNQITTGKETSRGKPKCLPEMGVVEHALT